MYKKNIPFTEKDMKNLRYGFNPSTVHLGMVKNEFGQEIPMFAPSNRGNGKRLRRTIGRIQKAWVRTEITYAYRWICDTTGKVYFSLEKAEKNCVGKFTSVMTTKVQWKVVQINHSKNK